MKLDKIILELKEIKEMGDDVIALERYNNLITTLENELKEECFKIRPSDKKRLATIKKVLNAWKDRPILQCFTPYDEGRVAFTDTYQIYILNEDYLPCKVAFTNKHGKDFEEKYMSTYGDRVLEKVEEVYPNLHGFTPENEPLDTLELKVADILALEKTTLKDSKGLKVYTFKSDKLEISVDLLKLKTCINILKLKDTITLELYGELRPIIIHNDENEIGLVLPVRTY